MKNILKNALLAAFILQNIPIFGYAISHNEDSELKEVTVFVFTSEEDFEKMLKAYDVSAKTIAAGCETVILKEEEQVLLSFAVTE